MPRIFTREDRARMATLENKMLSDNFDKRMYALNGDRYDPEIVDRSLEPSEALRDLKQRYPDLKTGYESALDANYNFVFTVPSLNNDKFKDIQFSIMQAQSDFELYKAAKQYCNHYEYERKKFEKQEAKQADKRPKRPGRTKSDLSPTEERANIDYLQNEEYDSGYYQGQHLDFEPGAIMEVS